MNRWSGAFGGIREPWSEADTFLRLVAEFGENGWVEEVLVGDESLSNLGDGRLSLGFASSSGSFSRLSFSSVFLGDSPFCPEEQKVFGLLFK